MFVVIRAMLPFLLATLSGCAEPVTRDIPDAVPIQRAAVAVPNHPGRSTSYLHAGNPLAPRVLFVHGTPGDATAFAAYLARTPADLEFVSADRPGFGDSTTALDARGTPVNTELLSYQEQAEALAPLLVERLGRQTILVGHSLGGPIIARLAADYPARVAGLVILAGSLDPDLETPRWYNELLTWSPIRAIAPISLIHANREVLAGREQTQLLAPLLPAITCPVTIVHGRKDSLVPYANVIYMQRTLTNAPKRIVNLPRDDHFIPWTQEELITKLILEMARPITP